MITPEDRFDALHAITLLEAMAEQLRETLMAMRAASGDDREGMHIERLLKEYVCIRDERPLVDAITHWLDLDVMILIDQEEAAYKRALP